MVKRAFNAITHRVSGLQKAAFWLASFGALSLILGFIRDRILANFFGAGHELDIYYAAFEIPDILFATVASIVSASILLPMFSERAENPESLSKFIDSVFSYFFIFITGTCLVALIMMPSLVKIFFGGFDPVATERVILYSRILLLSPLFLGFSNFFGSIVQFEKRFLLYALSPLFYNAGIIAGLTFGASSFGIISAVIGVAVGAFMHMAVQGVFVFSSPVKPRLSGYIFRESARKEVKKVFLLSIPRTISLSVGSLIGLFFVALASRLSVGSIAVFTLGFNLQSILLSLIGSSYSLATFPALAEHFVKKQTESLIQCLSQGLRFIIFWSLPASALFIVLRAHIVRVILGSGAFDWGDTRMTAAALALFVFSIVFQSIQLFLTRAHYAFGKTKLPLLMNMIGALFTITLAFVFFEFSPSTNFVISFLSHILKVGDLGRIPVLALPLSFSIGSMVSALLLWFSLDYDIRREINSSVWNTMRDTVAASLTLSVATIFSLRIFNDYFALDTLLNVFLHGLISGLIGIVAAILVLYLLKNKEFVSITGGLMYGKK